MSVLDENKLHEKLKKIKLVIFDCDGVLTDGRIIYNDEGQETKVFDVRDGHGIKLMARGGIESAILTARESKTVVHRAANLGIELVFQGMKDKLAGLEEILKTRPFKLDEIAYVGDDIIDLPVLKRVGLALTVADAVDEVKERADYVTSKPGGRGAVRELAELILKAQSRWDDILSHYLS
ncbi:MAG: HAD hydrolase family protein [Deltaproteobacteria bacterium]|nr:HAD hydrolase family protein [Deltaproteobacteria bacterium]